MAAPRLICLPMTSLFICSQTETQWLLNRLSAPVLVSQCSQLTGAWAAESSVAQESPQWKEPVLVSAALLPVLLATGQLAAIIKQSPSAISARS